MAASPEVAARVDRLLKTLLKETEGLTSLAESWNALSENDRVAWDLEWGEDMDRLAWMDSVYRIGVMTPEQRLAYRKLLRNIRAQLPVLRRLDLALPTVSLDEEAA